MINPFKRLMRKGQVSATEHARLQAAVEAHDRAASHRNLLVRRDGTGQSITDVEPHPIMIQIVSGANPYEWFEVIDRRLPDFSTSKVDYVQALSTGRRGDLFKIPAFEIDGNPAVPAGTIAKAFMGAGGDYYLFSFTDTLAIGQVLALTPDPGTGFYPVEVQEYDIVAGTWINRGTHWVIDANP